MKEIKIETRKIYGESYEFILNLPSYEGEKGVCGIEISPYITCVTPANDFGYNDFYHYHGKKGSFSHRYRTPYIHRKVNEFCEKFFTKYENGKYNDIINKGA